MCTVLLSLSVELTLIPLCGLLATNAMSQMPLGPGSKSCSPNSSSRVEMHWHHSTRLLYRRPSAVVAAGVVAKSRVVYKSASMATCGAVGQSDSGLEL